MALNNADKYAPLRVIVARMEIPDKFLKVTMLYEIALYGCRSGGV